MSDKTDFRESTYRPAKKDNLIRYTSTKNKKLISTSDQSISLNKNNIQWKIYKEQYFTSVINQKKNERIIKLGSESLQ